MPEAAQLGFGSEEMPPPSSAAGDVEALATEMADLKLDGGEETGGGEDGDGDSGCLAPQAEGEEGGRPAEGDARTVDVSHEYVSGEEAVVGAKESEVDKAWRGQEEWRKEKEVGKDGVAQEEDEKGASQENGKEEEGGQSPHPLRPGEPDCAYYVRTGHCAYGANCKFNHPLLLGKRVLLVKSSDSEKPHVKPSEGEKSQELLEARMDLAKYSLARAAARLERARRRRDDPDENLDAEAELVLQQAGRFVLDCSEIGDDRSLTGCSFSHDGSLLATRWVKIKEREKEQNYSSMGQIPCKYYQTPGGCKYGSNCRYMHESKQSEAGPELNILGLPMRLGQKECPFFMRTGSCKYGSNCRFHHPNPTGMGEPGPVSGYHDNGSSHQHFSGVSLPNTTWISQSSSNQSVPVDTLGSCVPGILLPHQLHQTPEWNGYQAPPNSLYCLEDNKKYSSVQTTYSLPTDVNGHSGQFSVQNEDYPQRPGQPECQFYMENGSCRYKSLCRFHHPKDRFARPAVCLLSPLGLPLRPDQSVCAYYSRHGICKFGPTCRFDHPMDRGSSKALPRTMAMIP